MVACNEVGDGEASRKSLLLLLLLPLLLREA